MIRPYFASCNQARRAFFASGVSGGGAAEAGLDETHISFAPEKGCYPGQEPVARLHYRGRANRELRVLEVEGAPPPETEVFDGEKAVGRVTSSVPGLALAYVRTTVPPDSELTVGGGRASLR